MKIHNVRLGHATNSSSTHSIVLLSQDAWQDAPDNEGKNFGWEYWTAKSHEYKTNYLALCLWPDLRAELGPGAACIVLKELFGGVFDPGWFEGAWVDHGTDYLFPRAWNDKIPNRAWVEEVKRLVLADNVVILGGNDNDEHTHPLAHQAKAEIELLKWGHSGTVVARQEAGMWVLYNQKTGAKLRFSFDGKADEDRRLSVPELVDIKITDWCDRKCPYCYQESSRLGQHAQRAWLLAQALGDLQVFEVAIGGGEPTAHPEFVVILERFREQGIVPSFSTGSLDWLRGPDRDRILELCGGFAFSPRWQWEIKEFFSLASGLKEKAHLQVVAAAFPKEELAEMFGLAAYFYIPVTMLGYKQVGRGEGYVTEAEGLVGAREMWRTVASVRRGIPFSADTAFMRAIGGQHGVNKILYSVREGWNSCYIDAVGNGHGKGQIGPSSYHRDKMRPLYIDWETEHRLAHDIKAAWEGMDAI